MAANKKSSGLALEDDAPDLSRPEWRAKFEKASVRRGRPPVDAPKLMTTLRLDPEVVEAFRAGGPGWQTRINDELKALVQRRAKRAAAETSAKAAKPPAGKRARA